MIGVGIDAVDVGRFSLILQRRPGFAERVFTPLERSTCGGTPSRLAARFAAKEATMKALGVGLGAFGFHEVWVDREPSGRPVLGVSGRAAALAEAAGVRRWHVSLTHTDIVAEAVVVAE
ncbi:MAG: holo-ACP synthase [Acidimicrobiales bacterium]